MKKVIYLLVAMVLAASCAGYTKVHAPSSPVNMGDRDMETSRFVQYTLTKSYFLGIGGLSEKARNTNVIQELFRKAKLKTNEALAYINVSENFNTFLGIISTIKTTASGYVVRPADGDYAPNRPVVHSPQDIKELYKEYERRISEAKTGLELKEIEDEIDQDFQEGRLNQKEVTKLKRKIEYSFF